MNNLDVLVTSYVSSDEHFFQRAAELLSRLARKVKAIDLTVLTTAEVLEAGLLTFDNQMLAATKATDITVG